MERRPHPMAIDGISSTEFSMDHWHFETLKLNGKQFNLHGVAHIPATLEIPEFQKELETAIARSSLVMLESAPATETRTSIETLVETARELLKLNGLGSQISDQDLTLIIQERENNSLGNKFFESLVTLAAKHHKKIATADPLQEMRSAILLETADHKIADFKKLSALASLTAILGMEGASRIMSRLSPNPAISRRTFLKTMGGAAAFGAANLLSDGASEIQNYSNTKKDRKDNPLGFALYNTNDYREVSAASALEQLSHLNLGEGPIETIYGDQHLQGIKRYLENPTERKVRFLAYQPVLGDLAAPVKIFSPEEDRWKQVDLQTFQPGK